MKADTKRIHSEPEAVDESAESELILYPDGRVFAFGITRDVAEVLAALSNRDERTGARLRRIVGDRRPGESPR
jgi:hypothetical protein